MNPSRPAGSRPLVRGDIVLVSFPFTDLSATKLRPAVILAVDSVQSDCTLAFIGSRGASMSAVDLNVLPSHPEFGASGLAGPSSVNLSKLATLNRTLIRRWLGRLGPKLMADLDKVLVTSLGINIVPYRREGAEAERKRLSDLFATGGTSSVLSDLGLTPP